MEISSQLKRLLKIVSTELRKNNIQFCLAGGWAVSMIGIARATMDIDLLMIFDKKTKTQVVSILENSFNLIQSHEKEMELKSITIWRNIVALKGEKEPLILDLLKADTDYLKSVVQRGVEIPYEGVTIPIVTAEDLIIIKLASFRKQDQVDIENVIHSGVSIDWIYLESTIKRLDLDWRFIEQLKDDEC